MEIRQLRYFIRIVELGSMSRAAADLLIAQPALSLQVQHLEEELSVQLLARSVRGVVPTDAGNVFYRHAQTVLRQIDRLREDVQSVNLAPKGIVTVGMPTSIANILAAPLILATQERYPGILLRITESLSGHLEELVVNGRLELSVLFNRKDRSGHLKILPLVSEDLYLVKAPAPDFSTTEAVTIDEAARERFVLPGTSNTTRQQIDQAFEEHNLTVDVAAELDSLSTITSVVLKGFGATITSLTAVTKELEAGTLIALPFEGNPLTRLVCLCTYDIVALSASAQCVAELIPFVTNDLVASGEWPGAILCGPIGQQNVECGQSLR